MNIQLFKYSDLPRESWGEQQVCATGLRLGLGTGDRAWAPAQLSAGHWCCHPYGTCWALCWAWGPAWAACPGVGAGPACGAARGLQQDRGCGAAVVQGRKPCPPTLAAAGRGVQAAAGRGMSWHGCGWGCGPSSAGQPRCAVSAQLLAAERRRNSEWLIFTQTHTSTALFVLPAFGFGSLRVCYDTLSPSSNNCGIAVGVGAESAAGEGEECGHPKAPVLVLGSICNNNMNTVGWRKRERTRAKSKPDEPIAAVAARKVSADDRSAALAITCAWHLRDLAVLLAGGSLLLRGTELLKNPLTAVFALARSPPFPKLFHTVSPEYCFPVCYTYFWRIGKTSFNALWCNEYFFFFFVWIYVSEKRDLTSTRWGNSAAPGIAFIVSLANVLFDPVLIVFSSWRFFLQTLALNITTQSLKGHHCLLFSF